MSTTIGRSYFILSCNAFSPLAWSGFELTFEAINPSRHLVKMSLIEGKGQDSAQDIMTHHIET
jgi:hypothetical protein